MPDLRAVLTPDEVLVEVVATSINLCRRPARSHRNLAPLHDDGLRMLTPDDYAA